MRACITPSSVGLAGSRVEALLHTPQNIDSSRKTCVPWGGPRLVLEEVVVEIALEAAGEGDGTGRPADAVGELHIHPRHDRLRVLRRQVHLDDLRTQYRHASVVPSLTAPALNFPVLLAHSRPRLPSTRSRCRTHKRADFQKGTSCLETTHTSMQA